MKYKIEGKLTFHLNVALEAESATDALDIAVQRALEYGMVDIDVKIMSGSETSAITHAAAGDA